MAHDIQLSMDQLEIVSGGANGITHLITVSQIKASNANEDAMAGALAGALSGAATKGPHKIG